MLTKPLTTQEEGDLQKFIDDMNNQPMQFLNKFNEKDCDTISRYRKLECLKMATLHATPEQVISGLVYKIANDYYNYIMGFNNVK
jgi:hypothetical protein